MKPSVLAGLAAGVAIPSYGVYLRYRRDMNAARARLAAVDRQVISTRWGTVEYAERGSGAPVLVVHGIYHQCVGGLLSVRDLFLDRRVIAPSRFGYLGSSMPPNATPAAQADAFAALLDALEIDQIDVVGLSAGATSALQLALRHPEKVKHLAVLVGNLPGSPTAIVQPSWTKRVNRQFVMWALWTFAPSTIVRMVAAVPREFAMSGDDARLVNEFIDSLFPMSAEGANFDLFVSNADVTNYNLEAIKVPTLIAHTKDDQLASHEASQRAAERIPGARFVSLESGGHLMLGQQKKGRDELAEFFAEGARDEARKLDEAVAAYRQQYPTRLQFPYGSPKYEKPFFVRSIWHDGEFTYLKTDATELPALYELKDGKPSIVNFQVREGTYVVPKVLDRGYLVLGSQRFTFEQQGDDHARRIWEPCDGACQRPSARPSRRAAAPLSDVADGGSRAWHRADHPDHRSA